MAGSPRYKIDRRDGTYHASCKSVVEACQILYTVYPGGKIRDSYWNRILHRWDPSLSAYEAAGACHTRQDEWAAKYRERFPEPTTENTSTWR